MTDTKVQPIRTAPAGPQPPKTADVYLAINAVAADLCKLGVGKDSRNTTQGYNFRGIDQITQALSPLLAKHGLLMLPHIEKTNVVRYESKNGGHIFNVDVVAKYRLVAVSDGTWVEVQVPGEAMDSSDKATNKAMSAAFKYAAIQVFCIPLEGEDDADATTHEPRGTGTGTAKKTTGISEEQGKAIDELITKSGADWAAIQTTYGIISLRDLTPEAAADLTAKLERKIANAAKQEKDPAPAAETQVSTGSVPAEAPAAAPEQPRDPPPPQPAGRKGKAKGTTPFGGIRNK